MKTRQKQRIEKLKRQICDVVGYQPVSGRAPDLPPDVEEAFLKRVLWYEQRSKESLRDRLAGAGVVMAGPDELSDEDISRRLWTVINALVTLRIVPVSTDHLSDREAYTHLWKLVRSGEPAVIPHYFSKGWYIDFAGGGEEGINIYLKYYANEEERLQYSTQFPDRAIPAHCVPPYDRDRLIPDL
ncbi:MAG: hypothetical protein HY735_02655 [Verrucomicrobia bacterium]|nr:hypothetical protein [Verrucomicrobiota bacterium]